MTIDFGGTTSTGTGSEYFISAPSSTPSGKLPKRGRAKTSSATKAVQNAIYAHLRAVRALGRTEVTVEAVAKNLGLSIDEVQRALIALRPRGVRLPSR